jgi:hypothetical protein
MSDNSSIGKLDFSTLKNTSGTVRFRLPPEQRRGQKLLKMTERDNNAIAAIRRKYRVVANPEKDGVNLEFAGVSEKFSLSTKNDEYTLFADSWHEHFPSLDHLLAFLDGLFSGTIQIVVKYRGKTAVGHQRQVLVEGQMRVVSQMGALVAPFWRQKAFKTLRYASEAQTNGKGA